MPENLPRVVGTVEWWSDEEGWGCLNADEAPGGAFVHFSMIEGEGYKTLRQGERVGFDLEPIQLEVPIKSIAATVSDVAAPRQ